jgi:CHAD domain-containing protein
VARAAEIAGLDAGMPTNLAAAAVVEVRAAEVAAHSKAVLDIDDIERLHDMRVATRRLRAALEIFSACFPKKAHRAILKEVKRLADALGARRDRDVTLAALAEFREALAAPDRPGVDSLVAALRREQHRANGELEPFVSADRIAALKADVDALVADARAAQGAAGEAAVAP